MKIVSLSIFIGTIFLVGCMPNSSGSNTVADGIGLKEYCPKNEHYCLSVPSNFDKLIGENNLSVYTTPLDTPLEKTVVIQPFFSSKSCSQAITGASSLKPISAERPNLLFGRVDLFDTQYENESVDPQGNSFCHPTPNNRNTYALCTNNKERTLVVCLNQATDSPDLAKQIFETFQWIK
jgi:hypothetical protein